MATKKVTIKKTAKKAVKKPAKKAVSKRCQNIYFWGGIAIALCAAGAFMIFAYGLGEVIKH